MLALDAALNDPLVPAVCDHAIDVGTPVATREQNDELCKGSATLTFAVTG